MLAGDSSAGDHDEPETGRIRRTDLRSELDFDVNRARGIGDSRLGAQTELDRRQDQ